MARPHVLNQPLTLSIIALGAALGYGNLVDFPLLVGAHGGSAFIVIFLLCQLFIAVPVLISELILGRRSQSDAVHGWGQLAVGRVFGSGWSHIGRAMVVAGFITLAVYSVLFSWSFSYMLGSAQDVMNSQTDYTRYFLSVIQQYQPLFYYQLLFFGILALLVLLSSINGLTVVMLVLVPLIFVLFLIVFIVSLTRVESVETIWGSMDYVFGWRWHDVTAESFSLALEHSFFSLGVGMGALWFCGSITAKTVSIGRVALLVVVFDLVASLLVALIFSFLGVFSDNVATGPGLLFQYLPSLLPPPTMLVFYFAMVLTGITSAMLIIEGLVLTTMNRFKVSKTLATLWVCIVALFLGLLGQTSYNIHAHIYWYGRTIFENYSMLASGFIVPLSGVLLAFFVGWVMRSDDAKDEWKPSLVWRFWLWRWTLRIISIIAIMLVFFAALKRHLGLEFYTALSITFLCSLFLFLLSQFSQISSKNHGPN